MISADNDEFSGGMESNEFCRQFEIPALLPSILRNFAKAAIKEHPEDINIWALEYFRRLHELEKQKELHKYDVEVSQAEEFTSYSKNMYKALSKPLSRIKDDDASLTNRISQLCTAQNEDGSGFMSLSELRKVFNVIASELSLSDQDLSIILSDIDDNDRVEYAEFVPLAIKTITKILLENRDE